MAIAGTRSGKIEGVEADGVLVFRGIPYAAPPVGLRRFLPPVREAAWDGVRDATRFGPESAQLDTPIARALGSPGAASSEDSLFLNVWTPACDDAQRPVMVWIHGGAYVFGSGSVPWYDGTRFAQHGDVVVVTINYRLGALGFLHLADAFGAELAGSGNAGILDQIAALEWVRDCIAAFGGNPRDVTVFGESAGGNSVATMLAMPTARGLFHKAIAQSAAGAWVSTRERAADVARRTIDELGVRARDVDALRALPTDRLLRAGPSMNDEAMGEGGGLPWQPVVDDVALFALPIDAVGAGAAAGVRLLTGTNEHEMTLFQILDPTLADLDDAGMANRLRPWADDSESIVRAYRAAAPDASTKDIWLAVATDAVFRIPAVRLAEAQLAHGPAWMYRFTWESPAFGGLLRSSHGIEIPFVFDNLDHNTEGVLGTGPERQTVADAMHRAWIAFARTGDPGWPAYDETRRATMRFDRETEVLDDPGAAQRRAWS
jgi:para-nitrobenzyl esterase